LIIRHAEKPGVYNGQTFSGVKVCGVADDESLVTLGWERAGGLANLFAPSNGRFENAALCVPSAIYASDPADQDGIEPSQRPYQTITALAAKLNLVPHTTFGKVSYAEMITNLLARQDPGAVLISWQHELILPATPTAGSIVTELLQQTHTSADSLPGLPTVPWPADRYDLVFVFDRPAGSGAFTAFTQVPQLLLAGDSTALIP
jgi:hypothetical protein